MSNRSGIDRLRKRLASLTEANPQPSAYIVLPGGGPPLRQQLADGRAVLEVSKEEWDQVYMILDEW